MSAPILDPDLLQAFVAVAEHRSFTRAASALNRTQSAVSMQVKRLEERLQAELFHRSTSSVDLSAAGEGLLGYARRILSLNAEAIGRVRAHGTDGRVRLGVMDDYGTMIVPPLLKEFIASYPLIHVEMETGLTSTMTDRLGEAYDLVIAMHPEGRGEGELLRTEQAVWAASAAHRVEELDPLPVALYPQGCLFRSWAMQALDQANRPWRLAFVSHSLSAVEAIAAQGLAVTVVKSGTFPPTLRRLTARDGMPRLPRAEIRLHRAQNLSHAASLLADHLVAALRQPARRAAI
ncbi:MULTISPECIES: LysR substrate-binding domain-containing protein [Bradyrhizobium]|jgi:DNA-binding transcriptional LysR family regulator|uniref:LysR substrate-binding domain-containing protein n=1 Tax=Bradyrhizobium TaxID=374 RepID=UPI0004824ACD|nr:MULTISPECIES: LysR substrate-binding domain-containing protein [Bradyrhizobium]MCS3448761.1 DNA-binding transcriptional LysR family regulator [Bradyrhizobium elkanii]MCS3560096.1 DNA-binding transcriptional LysR family regulator [Bradyrhizobium elkanii]MCW2150057.1 DNA-binding transcriptional LysR family regulator [Bradyrhizobium elkanii]MCW2359969.1 DNA-binding transcriptional LysR family regulator [Bradyrhizobium elkanii]MCW2373789.1 DNA-binding transcriptional LysR family regulator [Brad